MKPTRLTNLTIKNSMTIRSLRVNLADQGLVLVRGINHDAGDSDDASNGSAKSALFETIRHILLGSTARGVKGRQIVRAGSEGGYLGELEIERDGHVYTALQTIGHAEHGTVTHIYRGDELISHQRAKVRTQKQIATELLGMSAPQFDSWVFISQEAAHPLVNGSGAECSAYLSESFGLNSYDEMRQKLKETVRSTERQLGEYDAIVGVLAASKDRVLHLVRQYTSTDVDDPKDLLATEFDIQSAAHQIAMSRRVDRAKELTALLEQQRATEERERLLRLLGESEGLDFEVYGRSSRVKALQRTNERLGAAQEITKQRKTRADLLRRIAETTEQMTVAHPVIEHTGAMQANKARMTEVQLDIERLIGTSAPLRALLSLDGSTRCPTCGHDVDARHIAKEIKAAKQAATALSVARNTIDDLRNNQAVTSKRLETAERLYTQHREMRKQLRELPPEHSEDDTADLQARRDRLELQIERADQRIQWLRRVDELAPLAKPLVDLAREISTKQEAIQHLTEEAQDAMAARITAEQRIKELNALLPEIARHQERLQAIQLIKHQNDLRKRLSRAMGKLKIRRLHDLVLAIQGSIPPYVETMFGAEDVMIEVDDENPDSIERWCSKPHPTIAGERVRIPVQAMSKGEKAKLRVAFIWAIRKLMRPERTVNIIALDEADGGLDTPALEAYGILLEQLKSEYSTVFVISHRRELAGVKFDRVWTIEKRGGISKLTV